MGVLVNFLEKISTPLILYHAGTKDKVAFYLRMATTYMEIIASRDMSLKEADKLVDIIHANVASVYFDDQTANRTEYLQKTIKKVIQEGSNAKVPDIAVAFIITSITTAELDLEKVGYVDISEMSVSGKEDIAVEESPGNSF